MCFIGGCLLEDGSKAHHAVIERILRDLLRGGLIRGSDGAGYVAIGEATRRSDREVAQPALLADRLRLAEDTRVVLINDRLEPTSEYTPTPALTDIQPYTHQGISLVHNGIVANDAELRDTLGIDPRSLISRIDSAVLPLVLAAYGGLGPTTFEKLGRTIDGSYAIAAHDAAQPDRVYLACSYKPLWIGRVPELRVTIFASEPEILRSAVGLGHDVILERVPPYSGRWLDTRGATESFDLDFRPAGGPALCVCSGGMDSTTAAAVIHARGEEIVFCHFLYGCQAEERERRAVAEIARHYETEAVFVPMPWLGDLGGSTLTTPDGVIAEGDLGVETPHEWVPARNLLMIAHAIALCERYGYGRVVLGINEQEGEVFPDNDMEFFGYVQQAVSIGSVAHIELTAPLERMSKRDIVATALELEVPLHLTWSCYRSGEYPCGTCGSCLQRRVAFHQLGLEDEIQYGHDIPGGVLRGIRPTATATAHAPR
jgi:7-cyano-7-deazaguanine synthase